MPADKPIVITITVLPIKGSKRKLIVSGAPQGEMPVVHTGEFSQVHSLFNAIWAELIKRKPQVPKLTKDKPAGANAPAQVAPADSEGDAPQGDAQERDQLVASLEERAASQEAAPPAPLLSSIDDDEADAGSDAGSGSEEGTNTND